MIDLFSYYNGKMTFKNLRAFENSEHDHTEHEEMPSQVNKGFVQFSKNFFS